MRLIFTAAYLLKGKAIGRTFTFLIFFFLGFYGMGWGQTSFTSTSASSAWNASRWNNSSDAAPYTSTFTANNAASFTSGTYSFAGMGATINVGNITVASGVTVNFASIANTFATNGTVRTINVGSGGLFDFNNQSLSTAAGTGFIKSGTGVFATGAGTFTGGFTLSAGTVIARGTTGLGSGTGNTLALNGGTIASNANRDFANTRFPAGITIGGNVQFGEISTNVSLASNTANLNFDNNISLGSSTRTLTLGNAGITSFGGVISGSGGINFAANSNGTGSFALTTNNTYTGKTQLTGGIVSGSGESIFGANPGAFTADQITFNGGTLLSSGAISFSSNRGITLGSSGGTLNTTGGTITLTNIVTGSGGLTKSGTGTLVLAGVHTYSGATTVSTGTLQLNAAGTFPDASALSLAASTSFDLKGFSETIGSLAGAGGVTSTVTGTITLTSGGDNTSTTYSGIAQNGSATSLAITKEGSGTLTLTGQSTYTGTTTVNAGILRLNRTGGTTIPATQTVNVNNAATLQISTNQTLVDATLASGTTLTVDASTTLTITGTLTVNAGATINGSGTIVYSTGTRALVYNGSGSRTAGIEWPTSSAPVTVSIGSSATVTLAANNNTNTTLTVDGVLNASTFSIAGSGTVNINGTFITQNLNGLIGTGAAFNGTSPIINLGASSIIEYASGTGSQVVTTSPSYVNLILSSGGTKTAASALSISGTLTISGATTLNAGSSTIGGAGTNITMTGTSRYIQAGTGTRPSATGTYSLASGTTIEFSNTAGTQQDIRLAPTYANIDISGSNVGLSGTGSSLTLQSGSTFTVKSTGTFNVKNTNGFSGASNTAISNTNSPTVTLETGSTINYNDVAQPITPGLTYSNITLAGSGVKTAASAFTVNGILTLTGTASLGTTSPTYGASGTLAYVNSTDGITYTEALEWPATNAPASITVNLSGTTNPTVIITSNKTIAAALTLTAGTFNINGNTLTLNGTVAGSGLLKGSSASSITIGGTGSLGTLSFDQTSDGSTNVLSNLIYNRTITGAFSLGNKLVLIDVISPTAGTLTTGGFLHLRSTASNTARIAAGSSSGGYINGNVTVERFLSASSNRAYRLITPSVNASTTINANWQEGQSNPDFATNMPAATAGYGTHITGIGGSTNGFDATGSNQASLFIYNPSNPSWDAVTNTNLNTLSSNTGYLLFIRGNRDNGNVLQLSTPSSNTTLRATGTLPQGNISFSNLSSNTAFSLVTNPYASPILWDNATGIYSAGSNSTNFENYITIWDPNIGSRGGYVTVTTGNVTAGGATNLTNEIQSGQAFFVQTKTGIPTPSLDLLETHKSTTNNLNVFRNGTQTETLKTFLYYTDNAGVQRSADGVTSLFNNNYSNNIDGQDAVQIDNWDEDVAIGRGNKLLSIEARNLADANDTIPLVIARLKTQSYKWKLVPQNFNAPTLIAQLRDNFTNTNTAISLTDTTVISFSATADPASKAANRFCIVFKQNAAVPVTISSIKASTKNNTVQVEWETRNEINIDRYEVEKSVNTVHFSRQATQLASGSALYNCIDLNPINGNNFYRIKIIEKSGKESYTQVVKVTIGASASFVSVYPNPVANNQIGLQLNNLAKGSYHVSIINSSGQKIFSKMLPHNGGTSTEYLQINSHFSNGVYQLIVKGEGQQFCQELLKQ